MPGAPTVGDTRLGAETVAAIVWEHGIKEVLAWYPDYLSREGALVACWWAGRYSRKRKWKERFGTWAEQADGHLWYGCINIPDPPHEVRS